MNLSSIKHQGSTLKQKFFALSRKQQLILFGVIVLIVLVSVPRILGSNKKTPQYQTAQVTRGSIISTITESGNIASQMQASVASPTTGVIEEMYVKNGDQVVAGQNLFKVKATASPQDTQQAYASLLSAQNSTLSSQQSKQALQAQLETARQAVINAQSAVDQMNTNRSTNNINPATKQTYTQNDIDSINSALTSAKESFSATETKYKQADSSIAAASASQTVATMNYQNTQDAIVTAPIDGTVANLAASLGQSVSGSSGGGNSGGSGNSNGSSNATSASSTSSGSSTTTGSPVLIIGDFSNLSVKVQVSEIDIPTIHEGEKATITLDAFPGKTFVGTVTSVDTIGTSSSGVVTYNAYISLIAPPTTIQPGMSATATIQTQRKDDTLTVPTTAVQTINGQATVRVLKNGRLTPVDVTTGIASDTDTEITSGLTEGETVVTSVATPTTTGRAQGTSPFSGLGGRGGVGGGFGGGGRTGGGGNRVFIQSK
jgi:multidrug efflux pump subunit AcrA (membrane-fusion protein)